MRRPPRVGDEVNNTLTGVSMGIVKHITPNFMFIESHTSKYVHVTKATNITTLRDRRQKYGLCRVNWHNCGNLNPAYEIPERSV